MDVEIKEKENRRHNESETYRTQYTKDSCIFRHETGSAGCRSWCKSAGHFKD